MSKFSRLIIDNFQSHEHTELKLVSGLNVFVGPSDSGKSAILRALRWVLFNIPRGSDFIRTGAKECRVQLVLDDGTKITRLRSTTRNRYVLHPPDGEEQIFEAFGNQVPQEIIDAHKITSVKLDSKELFINFGAQLEPSFLLADSVGTKAKMIGYISGAHLIDRALKEASGDRHNLLSELKHLEKQHAEVLEQLTQYDDLPFLEDKVRQADQLYIEVAEYNELLTKLTRLHRERQANELEKRKVALRLTKKKEITEALYIFEQATTQVTTYLQGKKLLVAQEELKKQRVRTAAVIKRLVFMPEAQEAFLFMESKKKSLAHRVQLYTNLQHIKQEQERIRSVKDKYKFLPLAEDQLFNLNSKKELLLVRHNLSAKLEAIRDRITSGLKFCQMRHATLNEINKNLAELLEQLGRCPLCDSDISKEMIKKIREGINDAKSRTTDQRVTV